MADPGSPAPLRAVDLFCGAGGLSEGFKQAGYDVVYALDSDNDSCATYLLNHQDTHVEKASITDRTPAQIADRAGEVDVIVGGPRARQGFSTAGKKRWDDAESERNRLWRHMLTLVECLKPRAFLMENVPGMVQWKDGNFGATILKAFANLGYTVSQPRILLAADYGVPQRRRRLFIVGLLGDTPFEWPTPTHLGGWRRDTLDHWEEKRRAAGLLRHVSCWEAISDLPLLEGKPSATAYARPASTPFQRAMRGRATLLRDHEAWTLGDDHRALLEHVPRGGTWRDIPPYLLPDRFRGMRRTDSSNLLGRLDPTLPSYTITTQFTNVTVGCNAHPYEDRALTVREAARLQSFPDRYRFVGSVNSRSRQIGNAVPPHLAAVLAAAIARQLEGPAVPVKCIRPASTAPPPPTTELNRRRMRSQRRTDTKPEALLKAALKDVGITDYTVDARPLPELPRKSDLVFTDRRVAVFVDGCFWHGCPEHSRATKSTTEWWRDKIEANKARDLDTNLRLQAAGWTTVRVWEHEPPEAAAARVERALLAKDGGNPNLRAVGS